MIVPEASQRAVGAPTHKHVRPAAEDTETTVPVQLKNDSIVMKCLQSWWRTAGQALRSVVPQLPKVKEGNAKKH